MSIDNSTAKAKFLEIMEVQEENLKSLRLKEYLERHQQEVVSLEGVFQVKKEEGYVSSQRMSF